jgi:hypothetical protein
VRRDELVDSEKRVVPPSSVQTDFGFVRDRARRVAGVRLFRRARQSHRDGAFAFGARLGFEHGRAGGDEFVVLRARLRGEFPQQFAHAAELRDGGCERLVVLVSDAQALYL